MKYFRIWTDFIKTLEPLGDVEKGRLFVAMLEYAEQQTEPQLHGNERFIWPTVKLEIDRQIEAYDHKCEVNRANGASRTQSHPVAPSRTQSLQDKDKDKDKDINKNLVGFDEFWAVYPRKTGKGEARKAWAKIHPNSDLITKIIAAVKWQSTSEQWQKDNGQFIPHPATWLNQQRWEDEGIKLPKRTSKWDRVPVN